jgi:CRP-like cAMP-binding protein
MVPSSPAQHQLSAEAIIRSYASYLEHVESFSEIPAEKMLDIARVLRQASHECDENIIVQGDVGDRFFILIEGSVSIIKDGKEVNHLIGSKKTPQYFGERALLSKDTRAATVKVVSEKATTLSMDKANFDVFLRPSLAGPRRVQAALTQRLLEDARERHVLRGSYQARAADAEVDGSNEGYLSVIRAEAFGDVLGAARASLRARKFISTVKDDAATTRATKARRQRLMQKLRCIMRCVGRFQVIHKRIRAERNAVEAADSAWRDLQESIAAVSLGLASFALGSRAVKSFGLESMSLKSRGVGSMALPIIKVRQVDQEESRTNILGDGIISLGGGNVVAAFRSMRKTMAKTRNNENSLPRTPGELLKCIKPKGKPAQVVRAASSSAIVRQR